MSDVVVLYGTGEGQTAKVADRIAEVLADRGHDVDSYDLAHLPSSVDLDAYDAVLVGGSIHAGSHDPGVVTFVESNRAALDARPSAFFQVCLTAAMDDDEHRAEARAYVDDLTAATGWTPDHVGVFAGALRYSEYGFLKRQLMRAIAGRTTGDTDTSRDHEYTDFEAVAAFADAFGDLVEDGAGADAGEDEATPRAGD